MKKVVVFLTLSIVLSSCQLAYEITEPQTNVYLFGGQSNASVTWYETIREGVLKKDPTAVFVYSSHGGKSIATWYDSEPQENYIADLNKIESLLPLDEYNIEALFWFQGEADNCVERSLKYEDRFLGMINELRADLNDSQFLIITNIIASPDHALREIRAVQEKIAMEHRQIYSIDTATYQRKDEWHLTTSEYVRLGLDTSNYFFKVKKYW